MKKTIPFAVLMLTFAGGTFTVAQTVTHSKTSVVNGVPLKDDLFAGTEVFEKNATDVTEITMDPDSLELVKGNNQSKARRTLLNVIRTYSYDKPGQYNMADVEVFRSKLNTGDWHCSVHTRDLKHGESTDICYKRRTDDLVESAIVTIEPKELTFIHKIVRRSDDDKSDMEGEPLMSSLGAMPLMAGINPGEMAKMEAQMRVMQATMGPKIDAMTRSKIERLNTLPELQRLPKSGDLTLKIKRSPMPKAYFKMEIPDAAPAPGAMLDARPGEILLKRERVPNPPQSFEMEIPESAPVPPAPPVVTAPAAPAVAPEPESQPAASAAPQPGAVEPGAIEAGAAK